ncbi:hypothetical protein LEP1GSC035_3279 [Leptospira noguchii str. 2007001578]|uniref:Uncharacterized protein n=2 Tax=Leptospira noguchii TaxID=28182 RepID=M6YAE7_9LEPT|nr:hypothetical protein LEP1GSC035_3279 [Leptospira noguchii str. 2007001578]EMO88831.1 hypothetical protein LEP1GSC024_2112 [Leptospira noguchii str. 2001034031]
MKNELKFKIRSLWGILSVLFALVVTQSTFAISYEKKILTYNVVGRNASNTTTN